MKISFASFSEFLRYTSNHGDFRDCMSLDEASKMLGVSRQRVSQLVDSGAIDAVFIEGPTPNTISHVFVKRMDVLLRSKSGAKAGNPKKYFNNRVLENSELMFTEQFRNSASGWLMSRTEHLSPFLLPEDDFRLASLQIGKTSPDKIKNLLSWLAELPAPLIEPELVTITGHFMTATLLSEGLWKKEHDSSIIIEKNPMSDLQRWLFVGFNSWAPSIDLNPCISGFFINGSGVDSKKYPYLSCQIGSDDEAFSIPLLISTERKNILEIIAEEFSEKKHYAFPVKVRGLLVHKNLLSIEEKKLLGNNYDYCIKIMAQENDHNFIPLSPEKVQSSGYSGYIWVCLGDISKVPTFSNTYWCFEHTDLTNINSIKYNMDSLERKIEYIRNESKELDLSILHKSIPIIEGSPIYSSEFFYDFLLNKG